MNDLIETELIGMEEAALEPQLQQLQTLPYSDIAVLLVGVLALAYALRSKRKKGRET